MLNYTLDWLGLAVRWAHVITGIAWIGSSFYFVWLDSRLNRPPRNPEDDAVAGDLWSVHGGGFYHAQKYLAAPPELPEPLHWFKWEAYFTWMTGFALLVLSYYLRAETMLVDPRVLDIQPLGAIAASIGLLFAGWFVYDALCRLEMKPGLFAALGAGLIAATAFGVSAIFSARGAYIQIGTMLGTIMAANVLRVIIPGQKELVAAKQRGEDPDPAPGLRGKTRSVHNNYLTLPVVFTMISGHYPMTYAHEYGWLVLLAVFAIGVAVRHWFNLRNRGIHRPWLPIAAALGLFALAAALTPRPPQVHTDSALPPPGLTEVLGIVQRRCTPCHAREPTHPSAPTTAAGVVLEEARDVATWASRIHERTVITRTMPLANLTGMSEEERAVLARWYAAGAGSGSR